MLLSIITINLNNKAGLERTAQSIVSQTCQDYEWIVIDGGSTDGSLDVIEKYKSHISYWVSEPDKGIYHAMNKGIDVSHGEYLLFLNAADVLYDINVIKDFSLRDNKEDVIHGDEISLNEIDEEIWRCIYPKRGISLLYFFSRTLPHQATFIHRRCFEHLRYNENHKLNSDWEFFMTLYYQKYQFAYFQRIVTIYDLNGISSDPSNSELAKYEHKETLETILPQGIIDDYKELITLRNKNLTWSTVDIAIMCDEIIKSNKFIRYLLRIFLYPIYWLSKLSKKN